MQEFANIGIMSVWTGLIFIAWLSVKERGMKDRDLCSMCVGIILTLLIIWSIGIMVFLLTPTGVYFLFFAEGYNALLFVPIAIIITDFLWQLYNLKSAD